MTRPLVVVIGAGVSGLACAHRLVELQIKNRVLFDILLLEQSARTGGTIDTEIRDGFILEKGPDSFISEKPWVVPLCQRLKIESEIINTQSRYRKSFIARGNRLIPIPEGLYLFTPTKAGPFLTSSLFSLPGKVRMAAEWFIPSKKGNADESVGSFIRRRFGREALERAGQPMVAGIYTADPEKLSLSATFPRFKQLEDKYGSVIRGMLLEMSDKKRALNEASGPRYSLFLSFKQGMKTLTEALQSAIGRDRVKLNTSAKNLEWNPVSQKWRVILNDGSLLEADAVCLSTPSGVSSALLEKTSPALSSMLKNIRYESVATVNLVFKRGDIAHPLDGFGFVVPKTEKRSLVACTFSSVKFEHRAPSDCVLLRAFVGGAFGRDFFNKEDKELVESVVQDLSSLLGIKSGPLFSILSRYPDSMVQYEVGHFDRISAIKKELENIPSFYLIGSAYKGVGIPDCVRDAEETADKIFSMLNISGAPPSPF